MSATSRGDRIIARARELMGTPWVLHATDLSIGIGCAGLVLECYRAAGIRLQNPYEGIHGSQLRPGLRLLQQLRRASTGDPGDVVVFAYPHPRYESRHLGLVIGAGRMISSLPDVGVSELQWSEDATWAALFFGYATVRGR